MTQHLADTRKTPTIQDACVLMSEIRRLTCQREVIIARAEKRIAAITAKAQEDTALIEIEIEANMAALSDFILANKELFEKPRKHKSPDGTFGLQYAEKLDVIDKEALLTRILENGYDECIKITRSLVKKKIMARITEGGEKFPGCHVSSGDIVVCEVSKALVKEATENVT